MPGIPPEMVEDADEHVHNLHHLTLLWSSDSGGRKEGGIQAG